MKRFILFSLLLGFMSSTAFAQDDMYFTPKKSVKEVKQSEPLYEDNTRDVDEYNRRGVFQSDYYSLDSDSLTGDVINFEPGTYADTAFVDEPAMAYDEDEDFVYTRRMSRFDDFYWSDPWLYGYSPYWYGYPSYWRMRYGWYDPWYSWYDPWYYDFYRPWGWGWGYPHYWHRPVYVAYRGVTGTSNHGRVNYRGGGTSVGNYRGFRGSGTNNRGTATNRFSTNRTNTGRTDRYNSERRRVTTNRRDNTDRVERVQTQSRPSYNTNSSSFGGSRGGSFGGSRGGSFGGSRGGGGGSFGGRR